MSNIGSLGCRITHVHVMYPTCTIHVFYHIRTMHVSRGGGVNRVVRKSAKMRCTHVAVVKHDVCSV